MHFMKFSKFSVPSFCLNEFSRSSIVAFDLKLVYAKSSTEKLSKGFSKSMEKGS